MALSVSVVVLCNCLQLSDRLRYHFRKSEPALTIISYQLCGIATGYSLQFHCRASFRKRSPNNTPKPPFKGLEETEHKLDHDGLHVRLDVLFTVFLQACTRTLHQRIGKRSIRLSLQCWRHSRPGQRCEWNHSRKGLPWQKCDKIQLGRLHQTRAGTADRGQVAVLRRIFSKTHKRRHVWYMIQFSEIVQRAWLAR